MSWKLENGEGICIGNLQSSCSLKTSPPNPISKAHILSSVTKASMPRLIGGCSTTQNILARLLHTEYNSH